MSLQHHASINARLVVHLLLMMYNDAIIIKKIIILEIQIFNVVILRYLNRYLRLSFYFQIQRRINPTKPNFHAAYGHQLDFPFNGKNYVFELFRTMQ